MGWRRPAAILALMAAGSAGCQLDVMLRRLPPEHPIVVNVDADGRPSSAGNGPVAAEVLIEGAKIFDERCSPCHGRSGEGNGPLAEVLPIRPRNYHTEAFKWGGRPSQIVETIRGGRSGVMPPFHGELTPRQMWATAYVVWTWIPEDRREWDSPADLAEAEGSPRAGD
jgi:mono/diheme cytochrome c family protein